MGSSTLPRLSSWMIGLILFATTGCSNFQTPEINFGPDPLPQVPYSVTLAFDDSVRQATLDNTDCFNQPWQGQLGHSLATAFLKTSTESFKQVKMAPPQREAGFAKADDTDLTIQLYLEHAGFEGSSRTGNEPSFNEVVHIRLIAVVIDEDSGKPAGKIPLNYQERETFNLMPAGNPANWCVTGQYDDAMEAASESLARAMVIAVATWAGSAPGQTAAAPGQQTAPPPGAAGPAPISFQATLLDGNDNTVLEAGERVGIRLDATNTGETAIASATVTLAGSSVFIDAFANTLSAPMDIGPIRAGETKSTLFWGKMPDQVEEQRGELVVSIIAMSGSVSQTLVAAIRPTSGVPSTSPRAQVRPEPRPTPRPPAEPRRQASAVNRYALVIGLDTYRDPWPQAKRAGSADVSQVPAMLSEAAYLPSDNVMVLRNEHATKLDMVDAVLKWLPDRVNEDTILFVYVAGHSVIDAETGEVFIVPYEGTATSPVRRLVSLHALQGSLKRMKAKLALLFLDTPVVNVAGTSSSRNKQGTRQDWSGVIDRPRSGRPVRLVQVVAAPSKRGSSGQLLAGLNGKADRNRDRRVTLGELLDSVKGKARVYPTLPQSAPERSVVLTGP